MSFSRGTWDLRTRLLFDRHTRYPSLVNIFVQTQIASFTKNRSTNILSIDNWRRSSMLTYSPTLQAYGRSMSNRMNFCRFRSFNGHIVLWHRYFSPRLLREANSHARHDVTTRTYRVAQHWMPWQSHWDEPDAFVSVNLIETRSIALEIYQTLVQVRSPRSRWTRYLTRVELVVYRR